MIGLDQHLRERSKANNTSEEHELLQFLIECRKAGESYRSDFEDDWETAYRLYNRKHETGTTIPGRSNLFIPYVYSTIETVLPELLLSLFASENLVKIMPRKSEYQQNADAHQIMFDKAVEDMRMFTKLELALRDTMTYGDMICKVCMQKVGSKLKPFFLPIDPFDVVVDPDHVDLQDGDYVIFYNEMTYYEMEAMMNAGAMNKNVKKLKDIAPLTQATRAPGFRKRMDILEKSSRATSPIPKYRVWEAWLENRCVVWVEDQVIVRDTPNPFRHGKKPFIKFTYCPQSGRVYNDGIPILLENLQNEINKYRTARLDNVLLTINKGVVIDRTCRITASDLLIRPGMIVRSDDVNGVRELNFGNVDSAAFMEGRELERSGQMTTGVYDYLAGATPRHEETATGIIRLQDAGKSRIALIINRIQEDALPSFAEMVVMLNQQFAEEETVLPMIQNKSGAYEYDRFGMGRLGNTAEYMSIFREELADGEFDYHYTSRPEDLDINIKRNDAITMWNMFSQHPAVNPVVLIVDILKAYGRYDVNKYLNPQFLQALGLQGQIMADPSNPNAPGMVAGALGRQPMLGQGGIGMGGGQGADPMLMLQGLVDTMGKLSG